ncbi:hypothetical protein E2C01_044271 [Portunus trituberculatus]|uniref:Uncharacterized protein n=1 Tax=Portunus trituberculatus TaxID=210409 RepID=A0A5B7FZI9_PORTR|nr:hypothetical protein [Portunus trituberculatus]
MHIVPKHNYIRNGKLKKMLESERTTLYSRVRLGSDSSTCDKTPEPLLHTRAIYECRCRLVFTTITIISQGQELQCEISQLGRQWCSG